MVKSKLLICSRSLLFFLYFLKLQFDSVLESKTSPSNIKFLMETLTVGFDAGIASGDSSEDSDPYKVPGQEITYKKDNFISNH